MPSSLLWKKHSFRCGYRSYQWDYIDLPGKTDEVLLVTAGMDGDEVASIAAIASIASHYVANPCKQSLRFVRCINVPGYEAGVSWNPLDGKYPKHMLRTSSDWPTASLMNQFYTAFFPQVNVWIDLHGGSRYEMLQPFVWASLSGVREVDARMLSFFSGMDERTLVLEKEPWFRSGSYGKNGIGYVISEAGCGGVISTSAISFHAEVVAAYLRIGSYTHAPVQYRRTESVVARTPGDWKVAVSVGDIVKRGQELGMIRMKKGKDLPVAASTDGAILYLHISGRVDYGDELIRMVSPSLGASNA